jgi:hypothetical protein
VRLGLHDGRLHPTAGHCVRWLTEGNFRFLVDTRSGISGIACLIYMLIIGPPMGFEPLRSRIAFKSRKCLHYLLVAFCAVMTFHSPISGILNCGFVCRLPDPRPLVAVGRGVCLLSHDQEGLYQHLPRPANGCADHHEGLKAIPEGGGRRRILLRLSSLDQQAPVARLLALQEPGRAIGLHDGSRRLDE